MKKRFTQTFTFAALIALSACSSGPAIQEFPDTANPTTEVNNLDTAISNGIVNQIDVLAPRNFKMAQNSLSDAKRNLEKQDRSKNTLKDVAEGNAYLAIADQYAQKSRMAFEDVVIARKAALQAGTVRLFGPELMDADHDLMDVTAQIEKNDMDDAMKYRTKLQKSYRDLELKSIKETHLAQSRKTIALAISEGAKKYAPRTLAIAEKSLLDTESFINANRDSTSQLVMKAKETSVAADHILKITRDAKRGKKSSAEDAALAFEGEQNKVIAKQGELNESQDQLGRKSDELSDQKGETRALARDNINLAAEQALNARFETARTQFSKKEAEVYKQGNHLVIRLRGLAFPSSKASLRGADFDLLAKVQNVIREFGDCSVVVEGHTDSVGGKIINEELSSKRAEAVKQYFVSNAGSEALEITSVGYDYQKPLATNKTANGRAENRRVDVVIEAKDQTRM